MVMPTTHTRLLWRVEESDPVTRGDPARLQTGLRLHLDHAPLTMVLAQIGARQQPYLVLTSCADCVHDRCPPGCRAEMLRRLFHQVAPGLTLRPVPRGLATRPYTRIVLATPGPRPQPLDATLLSPWPEARLVVGWRTQRHRLQVGALLALGADGPPPDGALRERGWRPWPVPDRLIRSWARAALPASLLFAGARDLTPTLILPNPTTQPQHPPVAHMPELDTRLASWLNLVISQPSGGAHAVEPAPVDTTPSIWPMGPQGLAPDALGTLIAQILAEPRFQSTRKGQSGITKGRLAGLNYPGLTESLARTLVVWFDHAHILAPPDDGQGPWRAPRPFAVTDLEQIAAQLRATPLPSSQDVQAAYGGAG